MPNSATEKIKSARKLVFAAVLAAFALGCGLLLWLALNEEDAARQLRVHDQVYNLEVADTPGERQQGLSGRASLPPDAGMLFAYQEESELCFWMKDMHFPLDIIWLDAQRTVVHLEGHVSPDTYPGNFCAANAQYVIELNAGQAAHAGIETGQTLDF
jgi:uncharacterized membrane protein (UPF0127 family)